MTIQFNSIAQKAQRHKKELLRKISRIIKTGNFFHAKESEILTRNLKRYLGRGEVVLTASGHDALLLALLSLRLSPKHEVILPANIYPVAFPVAQSGATMKLVDVNENGLIDVKSVKKAITRNTRAIIIVHLYGLVADIKAIKKVIGKKNIVLIEDCAQAFGSTYKKRLVGTFGDIGCFSFYPTKNLGTLGDGGALWTKDKKRYRYFKKAVSYGESVQYNSSFVSGHSRLPEIQAAVLNTYFKTIKKELQARRKIFDTYQQLIKNSHLRSSVRLLFTSQNSTPTPHVLVAAVAKRDQLKRYLKKKKIPTLIHYPLPIHHVSAFSHLKHKKGDFPVAEKLAKQIISLPFHPRLTYTQVKKVIGILEKFYEKK